MIQEELSKGLLKKLASLQLSPKFEDSYSFKDTIKRQLLDNTGDLQFIFNSNKGFHTEIRVEDYNKALFSDYYFGRQRIFEQRKHLKLLLDNGQQVAWTLVTAYYSAFFMATEISKLFGIYMTSFSSDDMGNIISQSTNTVSPDYIDTHTSSYGFQVKATLSDYEGFVKLSFYKKSPRTHVEVWKNISEIVNSLDIDDNLRQYKTLFLDICNESNNLWHNPSRIRNDWNYTYAAYYSKQGSELGSVFQKNMRNVKAAMSWAGNRSLRPHESNVVASIAYIYHCLDQVIDKLDNRFSL